MTIVFLDAGVFIGALCSGDSRHAEARVIVEAARRGELNACTNEKNNKSILIHPPSQ